MEKHANTKVCNSYLIHDLEWKCLLFFLLFLPFQQPVAIRWPAYGILRWVDEIFILVMLVQFIFLSNGRMKRNLLPILACMLFFVILGLFSALSNQNSLLVTTLGIFDYLKNFLPVVLLCYVRVPEQKLFSLYTLLYNLTIVLCLVAIGQEIGFCAGIPPESLGILNPDIRLGIMRTPSLMGHPNIFGLYLLLFLILDISLHKKIRFTSFLILLGIILAFSRMVWIACFISLLFLAFKTQKRKVILPLAMITTFIIFIFPFFWTFTSKEMGSNYYRGYVLSKSSEIWSDHPISGVGPGMYGGVVSSYFNSPIYAQYNFSDHWLDFMKHFNSLDQFWPQVLAETGIIGTFTFIFFIFLLWYIPHKKAQTFSNDSLHRRLVQGLSLVPIPLGIYLLGSGLNLTSFLLTYSIFLGLFLGNRYEHTHNKQILIP